jgi:hypothetical protein
MEKNAEAFEQRQAGIPTKRLQTNMQHKEFGGPRPRLKINGTTFEGNYIAYSYQQSFKTWVRKTEHNTELQDVGLCVQAIATKVTGSMNQRQNWATVHVGGMALRFFIFSILVSWMFLLILPTLLLFQK